MDHVPEGRSTLSIGTPPALDLQGLKLEHLAHRILTSRRRSKWFERASWISKTERLCGKADSHVLRRPSPRAKHCSVSASVPVYRHPAWTAPAARCLPDRMLGMYPLGLCPTYRAFPCRTF